MNVLWFLSGIEQEGGAFNSVYASSRIRGLNLFEDIAHSIKVVPLGPPGAPIALSEEDVQRCDVAVFGKIFDEVQPLVDALVERHIPIVLDICDSVHGKPFALYAHLLRKANCLVAASENIQAQLSAIGLDSVVIGDAQPGAPVPFAAPNDEPVRLLWYGVNDNIAPFLDVLDELAARHPNRLCLDIFTTLNPYLLEKLTPYIERHKDTIGIEAKNWTLAGMDEALAACDIVIIPSSDEQFHQSKTANRLMTALWAGKNCVAYPVPSYLEFSDFVELNTNIADGVESMLQRSAEDRHAMVSRGQAHIESHHSLAVRARQWDSLIEQTGKVEPKSSATRLNLGCGDKILPGYTNVDVVDERAGNVPDIQCDIRDLTVFEDETADEILSVHVIEHFYYWEVHDVLKEWVRVLKPGGQMVIECPNLLSACEEVLKNPEVATRPGKEGQRSMWVFYGDPAWKDPLMNHKWLYTPQSLGRLMAECGLVDIKQTPARYKLREPRDMRLVAIKPFNKPSA